MGNYKINHELKSILQFQPHIQTFAKKYQIFLTFAIVASPIFQVTRKMTWTPVWTNKMM